MQELIHLIGRLHPVSDEFLQALTAQLKRIERPKRSLLLSPGEVSSELYFLEAGLVRGYYLNDGKEFSTGFMAEGSFIISPLSFFTQTPSYEYLELLEDSRLWVLSKGQLEQLYTRFIEFNVVGRLITEQYYTRSEWRAHQLRTLSADELYQAFTTEYAPILNRVSNRHIASFLGLTPETVSRIRAKKR